MRVRRPFVGFLGSLALVTGSLYADDSPRVAPPATTQSAKPSNQQIAQEIAGSIARAVPESGYSVDVECRGGVARLRGTAANPTQMLRIVEAAQNSRMARIVNEMSVGQPSSPVQTTSYQEPNGAIELAPAPAPAPAAAAGIGMHVQGFVAPPSAEHVLPGGMSPQFDMPYMPPFAWPAYAPYPNYSAVQYPRKHRGSDWPYVGPFYPYPERPMDWSEVKLKNKNGLRTLVYPDQAVPGNWQKVSLRWEDGHWYYRFYEPTWSLTSCLHGLGVSKIFSHRPDAGTQCEDYNDYSGQMHVKFHRPVCTHLHTRAVTQH